MKIKQENFCPLIKEECIGLRCGWFTQVRGNNPNTGEDIDEWGCAIAWLPIMLIENAQQQRQTGAAVESFRNEMIKDNLNTAQILLSSINKESILIDK